MKKVILQQKTNEIYLSDLKPDTILGATTALGNKFFLSKAALGYEWVGETNICSSSKLDLSKDPSGK